jgi:hypothetical protein
MPSEINFAPDSRYCYTRELDLQCGFTLPESMSFSSPDMRRIGMFRFVVLQTIALIALLTAIGCTSPNARKPGKVEDPPKPAIGAAVKSTIDPELIPAENLAKRVALYKLALQEGDLSPFTAKAADVEKGNFPATVKKLNPSWWKIPWGTTSLKPLPYNDITVLENDVFPWMAPRLDSYDKENGWALFTIGYDPDLIRVYIANAHKNWIPEEREIYLKGKESDCVQVWCGKINGEWKILFQITCMETTDRPVPPISPRNPPAPPESATSTAQN